MSRDEFEITEPMPRTTDRGVRYPRPSTSEKRAVATRGKPANPKSAYSTAKPPGSRAGKRLMAEEAERQQKKRLNQLHYQAESKWKNPDHIKEVRKSLGRE